MNETFRRRQTNNVPRHERATRPQLQQRGHEKQRIRTFCNLPRRDVRSATFHDEGATRRDHDSNNTVTRSEYTYVLQPSTTYVLQPSTTNVRATRPRFQQRGHEKRIRTFCNLPRRSTRDVGLYTTRIGRAACVINSTVDIHDGNNNQSGNTADIRI